MLKMLSSQVLGVDGPDGCNSTDVLNGTELYTSNG